eukprot:TRINITY_DN1967_c0_g1_i2.p1 TRINITY_DN1967_c0_g1~~TRINITY_DN1967_c0_g1_i2.p1  ORF type:complete len:394 (-),score=81.21 TRINITY_DN1967_c0_g1_i2:72-1253(-)
MCSHISDIIDPRFGVKRADCVTAQLRDQLTLYLKESGGGFPQTLKEKTAFIEQLIKYFHGNDWETAPRVIEEPYIGFDISDPNNPRISFLRLKFTTFYDKNQPGVKMKELYDLADAITTEVDDMAPPQVGKVKQTSASWVFMTLELELISGSLPAWGISLLCGFASILLFTRSIKVPILTAVCISCIILFLVAAMVGLLNWKVGAVEALAVTVFFGASVDYALHVAHAFVDCQHQLTKSDDRSKLTGYIRIRHALTHVAVSVFAAGLTTAGAACIMLLCIIQIFVRFGTIVALTTLGSLVYALAVLATLLMMTAKTPKKRFDDSSNCINNNKESALSSESTVSSAQTANSTSTIGESIPSTSNIDQTSRMLRLKAGNISSAVALINLVRICSS